MCQKVSLYLGLSYYLTWSNEGGYRGQFLNGVSTTDDGGAHSHSMSGGDAETRPLNVAVNYIIKY